MREFYNADNIEIMKKYPDKYFNLAIVDPPYGINIGKKVDGDKPFGKSGTIRHGIGLGIVESKTYKSFDDSRIPGPEYFKELFRVSKNQIIWGGNYFIEHLFNTSCMIVWDKVKTGFFADAELAWTSFKTATRIFKYQWNGLLQEDMKNKEKRIHPCLPAGQKVYFNKKWDNIENIKIGDKNRYGQVINISNHYADKLIEIKTGKNKTTSTWNHPFLIKRDNIIYWIQADKIKKGDYLLTSAFVYDTLKPLINKKKEKIWDIKRQKKVISDIQKTEVGNFVLNIVLYGKDIMVKFLSVCRYIIKILIKQTTIFQIYNLSRHLNINGITPVVELSMVNGKSPAKNAENIKNVIKKIGIIQEGGLTESYVKNVLSKNLLKRERFSLRKVGNVKIINQKTKVYNLTMSDIPAFDTEIGLSHNTQKPVALYKWLIRNYAEKGQIILDTHVGSGSSLIACEDMGLDYVACEIDTEIYNDAVKRLNQYREQLKLFEPTFEQ